MVGQKNGIRAHGRVPNVRHRSKFHDQKGRKLGRMRGLRREGTSGEKSRRTPCRLQ